MALRRAASCKQEGMGHGGRAHLRDCSRHGPPQALQACAYPALPDAVNRLAERAARIHRAWELACVDFDRGAVSAALPNLSRGDGAPRLRSNRHQACMPDRHQAAAFRGHVV